MTPEENKLFMELTSKLDEYEDIIIEMCKEQKRAGYVSRKLRIKANESLPECKRLLRI